MCLFSTLTVDGAQRSHLPSLALRRPRREAVRRSLPTSAYTRYVFAPPTRAGSLTGPLTRPYLPGGAFGGRVTPRKGPARAGDRADSARAQRPLERVIPAPNPGMKYSGIKYQICMSTTNVSKCREIYRAFREIFGAHPRPTRTPRTGRFRRICRGITMVQVCY